MKRILTLVTLLFGASFLLSGCSAAMNGGPGIGGTFHTYFVEPFASLIHFVANIFGGSYGISIILITILIRLLLMPLVLKQYKNQGAMKDKMAVLKPEMDAIQKKLKATKDPAKQKELQAEMMSLYRKHGVNPLNMGCLPALIQMPIIMGFYYAIRGSHEISGHGFLWFSLGQPDIPLSIMAGIVYYYQFKVTQVYMPEAQQKQMKFMGLLSPGMILFFSFTAPAALPLYWVVSGAFLVGQTVLAQKLYKQPVKELKKA